MEIKSCDGRAYCLLLCAALIFSKVQISITEGCVKDSNCKFTCSGTVIELEVIDELFVVDSGKAYESYDYTYKPCAAAGVTCDATITSPFPCAICQSQVSGTLKAAVGFLDDHLTFDNYSQAEESFVISYYGSKADHCPDDKFRHSKVSVKCGSNNKLNNVTEEPLCTYNFDLTAKCKISTPTPPSSGLSIGSILIIVFVVVLILYILIGFLIQRFVRGAQGIDQIPNREFWVEIPILTKEGCCFVIGCCRQRATSYYEKI